MFLLDGSINFRRDNFQEVLRFVSEIVDTLYEAGDSIQVGLVQYNSDPTDEFFLKDFSTKQQIIDAINKVVYKGGRHANTKVGLQHLRLNHFVPEAGSRLDQRVPQIAFVITGGKSAEDAQEASLALTQRGIKVFAVGVKNIDSEEVGKIASNSATAFRVGNVQELSELSEQVLETLHDAMHETLCPGVSDVSKGDPLHVPIVVCPIRVISLSRSPVLAYRFCNKHLLTSLGVGSQRSPSHCYKFSHRVRGGVPFFVLRRFSPSPPFFRFIDPCYCLEFIRSII